MHSNETPESVFADVWHEETARNSIDRWNKVCEHEGWQGKPYNRQLLIRIFGASWYFTRFIFATGLQAIEIIDRDNKPLVGKHEISALLEPSLDHDDVEVRTNHLRILKNKCMLQILVGYMQQNYTLAQLEIALTQLAESTLEVLINSVRQLPQYEQFPLTVLAMGRMAGYEMTFGSDLDLIFLYDEKDQELYDTLGRTIRLLLRTIAQPASVGLLYDVDMRLRPHGNSGLLVTSYRSFIEYHEGKRDIWERQMMTRCRPVIKCSGNVEHVLEQVNHNIYAVYDRDFLRTEILNMRTRVQKELGSPKGKYEIKRGYGGIMDIDFISHYFQLLHGHQYIELQTCSTRQALRMTGQLGLIDSTLADQLIVHYDYLKKVEMCLRLFDMKSIDSFRTTYSDNTPLSRSMGHGDNTGLFIEEFESVTRSVRHSFDDLLA
jgi:glutamate-ammonia-ligase adenylyltransferase